MTQLKSKVSTFVSSLRPLMIAAACALVLFANATPAFAFGGSSSSAEKGLEQLGSVQEKSEAAISNEGKNGTRNVVKNSKEGLNGVQGAANKKDMTSPSDASGNTIEGNIEEALDEMTP
ncbi:MAG: hypothetical protein ACFB0D_06095 [Phormidesmis sp.]